jgi:hypothetical protein
MKSRSNLSFGAFSREFIDVAGRACFRPSGRLWGRRASVLKG